jgi:hypothetical protein
MSVEHLEHQEHKPLPGWACIGLGVGFVALLVLGMVAVRLFS